jgi:hypothetical protein
MTVEETSGVGVVGVDKVERDCLDMSSKEGAVTTATLTQQIDTENSNYTRTT